MYYLLKYFLYEIVLNIFKLCEAVLSYLGLLPHPVKRDETRSRETFSLSVERRNIIWKHKLNIVFVAAPTDFISWPAGSCDYSFLLKDNVSLYCITRTDAWFVETPEDTEVYSSQSDPFLYASQYKLATRLYVISLESLIALGDFLGDPQVPVILLSSHGRCGSTLLSQAFETVPGALTLAEPDPLTNAMSLNWKDRPTWDYLKNVVCATMKVMCRKMAARNVSLYCVKTRGVCLGLVDVIADVLPEVKHLYLYRNCVESVSSMEKSLAQGTESVTFLMNCNKFKLFRAFLYLRYPDRPEDYSSVFGLYNKRFNSVFNLVFMASASPLGFWTVVWGVLCAEYLRLRQRGINIAGVRYEDFLSSTESVIQGLSAHTGIELNAQVVMDQVMKNDSQRGSFLSKEKLASFKTLVPDEESRAEMQDICKKLGLPKAENEALFPGTLQGIPRN